jgi:hypothetical protein
LSVTSLKIPLDLLSEALRALLTASEHPSEGGSTFEDRRYLERLW